MMIDSLKAIDVEWLLFVNRSCANGALDTLCPIFREKTTWIPLYALVLYLWIKKQGKEAFWLVLAAVIVVVLSDQLALFTKNYFERIRPCAYAEISKLIILRVKVCSQQFSFVSAHAANHFAQATFYSLVFRKPFATLGFLLWALLVACSQVYVGVHYPSDVLAGALLGIGIGGGVYFLFKRWKPQLFSS